MVFSNEDEIIIQNDYKEKTCSTYKIGKNHPSKKWNYSSVKHLLEKFRDTDSMGRRHGSGRPRTVFAEENTYLIEEWICSQEERPHTHLTPRKITKQTGSSWSLIWGMVKKETLTVEVLENTTNG